MRMHIVFCYLCDVTATSVLAKIWPNQNQYSGPSNTYFESGSLERLAAAVGEADLLWTYNNMAEMEIQDSTCLSMKMLAPAIYSAHVLFQSFTNEIVLSSEFLCRCGTKSAIHDMLKLDILFFCNRCSVSVYIEAHSGQFYIHINNL